MSHRLDDDRYVQIKMAVVGLYQELCVKTIPVDAWDIAKKLGITLLPYTSLNEEQREAALLLCNGGMKFNRIYGGVMRTFVVYDDSTPIGRQRFTILHELGHVVLRHRQDSVLADAEADFFAKYAIAPPMLVYLIHPTDYLDIAEVFGLSRECAFNSMNYYNKWLRISGRKEYECDLVKLFAQKDNSGSYRLRVRKSA